jgi:hypothetical protein
VTSLRVVVLGIATIATILTLPTPSGALSLRTAPLSYDAVLAKGESKKGAIDITNTGNELAEIKIAVQAFRQVDDSGSLEFYPDEQIAAGVRLDYTEATLGPKETLHLIFLLDGTKLPTGNVFAGIFATTRSASLSGVAQAVQVGTLLMIQNGTPMSQEVVVGQLDAPFFQVGDAVTATISLKNMSDPKRNTGSFPNITVALKPYTEKTIKGPLIFAGRARMVEYRHPGDYFGFIPLKVTVGGSSKAIPVFAVTGYWRWLAPLIGVAAVVFIVVPLRLRGKRRQ